MASGNDGHNASPADYIYAVKGVDFPAPKDRLVRAARDTGGLDAEVLHVFENLPDRTYDSASDLRAEVARVYRDGGGLEGAGPAASARPGEIPPADDPRP